MDSVAVKRTHHRLLPDSRRVLAKPYLPGEETLLPGESRAHLLMMRIMAIPERALNVLNAQLLERFSGRHHAFVAMLERHFELVAHHVPAAAAPISRERRLLIGAYFTHEYAVEAAALFNPSIVLAPDQAGLSNGSARFIMSLRAVGEGHLSSIEFRSGVLDALGGLAIDPFGPRLIGGRRTSPPIHKAHFNAKLLEMGASNDLSASVMRRLGSEFTCAELEASLETFEAHGPPHAIGFETLKLIRMLASSNYVTVFPAESELSERVIFPAGPNESRGMEDARFVRFTASDGGVKYYATYTAYDGFEILPQLIETEDFARFTVSTLHGAAAQNKGMALFPRPIDGKYVMLSRKDRENLHLSTSSDVHHWDDVVELYRPRAPWELLQIGNCGSPIETEAGWLVLTHGVGPMRRYAIGALLLDRDRPENVIGSLPDPLIEPDESERDGYVPNVVYTCDAIVHADQLIIPYGFSDAGVAVAQVALPELLEALLSSGLGK